MKLLFATTNQAKIQYYDSIFKECGIDIVTLDDLHILKDIEETGNNPVENAVIKATAYNKISHIPTISLDEGLFFDDFPLEKQPKTFVRRINGRRLNDEEMLNYYIGLVNKYGINGFLKGYFLKGFAIVDNDQVFTFEHKMNRTFTNQKSSHFIAGYPLESIQIISEFNKFSSDLNTEEKSVLFKNEQYEVLEFIKNTTKLLEK